MKLFLSFLSSLLFMSAACSDSQPKAATASAAATDTVIPIFREISIAPHGNFTLDSLFTQRDSLIAHRISPRAFVLVSPFGRLANTDSIVVTVDSVNCVRFVRFVYEAGTDVDAAVTDYESSLGKATIKADTTVGDVRVTRWRWTDSHTAFDFVRSQAVDGVRVFSVLRNLRDVESPGAP